MKLAKLLLLIFIVSCTSTDDTSKYKVTPVEKEDTYLKYLATHNAENSIVLLLPMSGTHKDIGKNVLNSILISNRNADVDFYVIDTANCPDNLNQDSFKNLKFAIGPIFFQEIHKYATIFRDVPIFSLSNNIKSNDSHIYVCGLSPQEEIKTVFDYISKNNMTSIAAFLPEGEFFDDILNVIQKECANREISEDEINVVRYNSATNLSDFASVPNSTAVFLFEPMSDLNFSRNRNVFTLSSIALSNPKKWEGVKFAYADNQDQHYFIEAYQKIFKESPTVISLVASDIVRAINESLKLNVPLFDEYYDGVLGKFKIQKEKGVIRNLEIFEIKNGEKIKIEDEKIQRDFI